MMIKYIGKKFFRRVCFIGILMIAFLFLLEEEEDPNTSNQDMMVEYISFEENQMEENQREEDGMETKSETEHILVSEETNSQEVEKTPIVTKLDFLEGESMNENKFLAYPAGTIVKPEGIQQDVLTELFYSIELTDEIKVRINGKSYGANASGVIPYDELRYLRVLFYGFDGETHMGEMIVNRSFADDMIDIFKELYDKQYPIEKMVLVDDYDADDNASMADNNSSSFNYRNIDRSDQISLHSYGLAVDINPLYNPYVREIDGETVVLPDGGEAYTDRTMDNPYIITKGDVLYDAFIKRGFTWGGEWKNSKDYQHFQKSKE